jgi:hypothetical protein
MPAATRDTSCFAFLDSMRKSGVTSMALAIPRLRRERQLGKGEATAVLARWAERYEAIHHEAPLFEREVRPPRSSSELAAETMMALRRVVFHLARAAPELAASFKSAVLRHSSHAP